MTSLSPATKISRINSPTIVRWFFLLICISSTVRAGWLLLKTAKDENLGATIIKKTVAVVSETFGTEMTRDYSGNINILIAGYGGRKHSGGFLTDAIMLASRNPDRGAVTMVSSPRDLYISLRDKNQDVYLEGRINEIFTALYGKYNRELARRDHPFVDPRLALLTGYIAMTSKKNPADIQQAKLYLAALDTIAFSGTKKEEILSHPCFDESMYPQSYQSKAAVGTTPGSFDNFADCLAFHEAAMMTIRQYKTIFGLDISYYILFDFAGFAQAIDVLGGIDINVPEPIYDRTYPSGTRGRVITFALSSGMQHLDGETALKYARSRHSTSDFDRAGRQQLILKAVIEKIKEQGLLSNITKIKGLYATYKTTVQTNISLDHMLGMAQYVQNLQHMFSFVLTTRYSEFTRQKSEPGGFLYTPVSVSGGVFGGASVILPNGATAYKIGVYDTLHFFVDTVTHHQGYLIEKPAIRIANGIDSAAKILNDKLAKTLPNKRGVKLRKYNFNIVDIQEFGIPRSGTTIFIKKTGAYPDTIAQLRTFLDIPNITVTGRTDTGIDMKLILGNDYAIARGRERFDYDR